jgi:hypothetical protein
MRGLSRLSIGSLCSVVIVFVLGSVLLSSACSESRGHSGSTPADKKEDAGSTGSSAKGETGHPDRVQVDADSDSGDNEKGSVDAADRRDVDGTAARDAGDARINATNEGGSNASDVDSAGSGVDSGQGTAGSDAASATIHVPYESLQSLPDTSARLCPNASYSGVTSSGFLGSCDNICPNAHCVPNFFVPDPASVHAFPPCDSSSVCIPDYQINTTGGIQYKKCRSIGNLEGACVSVCNLAASTAPNTNFLPQDTCIENEVCVPCYDPIKNGLTAFNPCGNYTAASCNGGATEDGVVFDKCCNGNGTCVPGLEDIYPEVAALLGRNGCTGEDDLCLPALFSVTGYLPAVCETAAGEEGRCLSDCVSSTLTEKSTRQDCATNERCIPCSTADVSTGACVLNGDKPGRDSEL